jgi:hypothetical protein
MMSKDPIEQAHTPTELAPGFTAMPTRWSRVGEFVLGLLSALYVVLAVVDSLSGSHEYLWLTLPFCSLWAVHFLRRSLDSSPRLEVDSSGIIDRTSMFGGELRVPWEDVLEVVVRGRGVELVIRDLRDLQRRSGFGRRIEILVRRLSGRKTMLIVPTFLGIPHKRLAEALQASLDMFERTQLGLSPDPPTLPAPDGQTAPGEGYPHSR